MTPVAKALGITVPQAHELFRVPEYADIVRHIPDSLGWHSVHATRDRPYWHTEASVNPKLGQIFYNHGQGVPGQSNALHTVKSLITARDLGYKSAHIHVALGGKSGNGAYTYPRLGFTARVQSDKYPHYDFIHQLMANPEAREHWKQNHKALYNLHFDLTPGSDSFKRLEGYLRERFQAK